MYKTVYIICIYLHNYRLQYITTKKLFYQQYSVKTLFLTEIIQNHNCHIFTWYWLALEYVFAEKRKEKMMEKQNGGRPQSPVQYLWF